MEILLKKVVRVTDKEFELDDGSIFEHFEKLDYIPTVEEFQKIYESWIAKFQKVVDNG